MKSKKAKRATKAPSKGKKISKLKIIAGFFIFCLFASLFSGGGKDQDSKTTQDSQQEVEQTEAATEEESKEAEKEPTYEELHERYKANFLKVYNANCNTEPLVFVEDYALQDKDSGHYRVEYRLPAYEDEMGTYCTIGDSASMEILGSRVYIEGDTPTVIQASIDILRLFYPDDISEEELADFYNIMNDPEESDFANQYAPSLPGIHTSYYQIHPETSSVFIEGGIPVED